MFIQISDSNINKLVTILHILLFKLFTFLIPNISLKTIDYTKCIIINNKALL